MTYIEAIRDADLFMFRQVHKEDLNRMSVHVVVHGISFKGLMIKLKHTDKTWRDGL